MSCSSSALGRVPESASSLSWQALPGARRLRALTRLGLFAQGWCAPAWVQQWGEWSFCDGSNHSIPAVPSWCFPDGPNCQVGSMLTLQGTVVLGEWVPSVQHTKDLLGCS